MNRFYILKSQLTDHFIQKFDSLVQRIQQRDFKYGNAIFNGSPGKPAPVPTSIADALLPS